MDRFLDFMSAALPWILMGFLLAIFFAVKADRDNETHRSDDHYGTN